MLEVEVAQPLHQTGFRGRQQYHLDGCCDASEGVDIPSTSWYDDHPRTPRNRWYCPKDSKHCRRLRTGKTPFRLRRPHALPESETESDPAMENARLQGHVLHCIWHTASKDWKRACDSEPARHVESSLGAHLSYPLFGPAATPLRLGDLSDREHARQLTPNRVVFRSGRCHITRFLACSTRGMKHIGGQ